MGERKTTRVAAALMAMSVLPALTAAAETPFVIGSRWRVGTLELDAGLTLEPAALVQARTDDASFMAVVCARDGRPAVYLRWPASNDFEGISTTITVRVDGGRAFTFEARAVAAMLETPTSPPAGLLDALAAGYVAEVAADGVAALRVGLTGSAAALRRVLPGCT